LFVFCFFIFCDVFHVKGKACLTCVGGGSEFSCEKSQLFFLKKKSQSIYFYYLIIF